MTRAADLERIAFRRQWNLCRDCERYTSRSRCFNCARRHASQQAVRDAARRAKQGDRP